MKNAFRFTKTVIRADVFLKNTENRYMVVAQAPYLDKKAKIGSVGTILTLMITKDSTDYGIDKNTQRPRENNVYETFDVTILNGKTHLDVQKGDFVALDGFDEDHSYFIDNNLILRFKDCHKLAAK